MKKLCLIYDGLNLLIPSLCVKPIYNSNMFNVFPIIYFLRRIFKDIILFLDYFNIENKNSSKFELLIKNNIINFFINENIEIYIVFDFGADISRRKLQSSYKKNRSNRRKLSLKENLEKEISLYRQILYDLLSYLGYKTIILPFVEADGVISFIVENTNSENKVIISNDSDYYELLSNNTFIYNHKEEKIIIDDINNRKEIFYKLGYIKDKSKKFYPSLKNTVYFKSLLGDKSDMVEKIIDKRKFRILMNKLINDRIEFIPDITNLINILKELNINFNERKLLNNFNIISLKHYIEKLLKANDKVYLYNKIKKEQIINIEKFIEVLKNFELGDYKLSWLYN